MLPRLHLVTDAETLAAPAFIACATAALQAGGPAVALHLRGHGLGGAALYALATALAPVARRTGALLLANDRVDVALAAGLTGVQLGRRSLPVAVARALLPAGALVGYSAHDAAEAAASGADFVLLGTIYESRSHPDRAAAGTALISETVARTEAPVIAIGGVTPGRVADTLAAGAYGVAVLGGVWRAGATGHAVNEYIAALAAAPEPVRS